MLPIRTVVRLSGGAVSLQGWPPATADAHLHDLAAVTDALMQVRHDWDQYQPGDFEPRLWGAFWRLVQASMLPGAELPRPVTWADRLRLLDAMWELNELEEAEGKQTALGLRLRRHLRLLQLRNQGQQPQT